MGMKELVRLATQFLVEATFERKANEKKPLVLCVEDDGDTLAMLKLMLESRGYEVLTASTIAEALRLASEHKNIHSLVTDFHIHGQTATDLIQALGDRKPKNVVLLSGKHFAGDAKQEVPGIDSHVSKPFQFKNLIEKIDVKPRQVDDR